MRIVAQRVAEASVAVDGEVVGAVGVGLLCLVGVTHSDTAEDARLLATKIAGLRVFADDDGKMNRSILDVGGEILVVSQFTLYGDARKGRRPSFTDAADPTVAEPLVDEFVRSLEGSGVPVARGVFGAMMAVSLINDGPVTLVVEASRGRMG